jgi:hypothetical protein
LCSVKKRNNIDVQFIVVIISYYYFSLFFWSITGSSPSTIFVLSLKHNPNRPGFGNNFQSQDKAFCLAQAYLKQENVVQNQIRQAYSVCIHIVLISRGSLCSSSFLFILTLSPTSEPHDFHASKMMRRLAVKNLKQALYQCCRAASFFGGSGSEKIF